MIPPLILGGLFDAGLKLIDKLFPDPGAANDAKLKLLTLQQTGELAQLASETDLAKGQLQTNVEEAKSSSVFVSGWRPFIGWTCGTAFAFKYIGGTLLVMIAELAHIAITLPLIDTSDLMPVLFGMLGLGGLRTIEKIKGAA